MLRNIIDLLQEVNGETENIRIAQGKYHLPETLKDSFNVFKKELRWQKQ